MKKYAYFLFIIFFIISCFEEKNSKKKMNSLNKEISNIEKITKKIRNNPKNSLLFSERAKLFFKKNEINNAINDINIALKLDSLNANFYIELSEYELIKGKSGKSKDILEKCIKIYPNHKEANLKLGQIYLYVKDYKKSIKIFNKVQKICEKKEKINFKEIAEIYFLKSIIFEETKDTTKAIKNLQIAIENNPKYYEAISKIAFLFMKKRPEIAIEYYKKAMEIMPKSIEVNYNLALIYQNQKKFSEAIGKYNFIIENIDSTYYQAFFNIGFINSEFLKKNKIAIENFTKAIKFNENYVSAYYKRGNCFEKIGKKQYAKRDYLKAMEILPNYSKSIESLNRLENNTEQ
ncbi:MAG: hypothetical protein B6I24_03355 [Bacteroidetes bacterium 4572_128]|nr:MAG: hypothetical protein B6I24_03355 [Bacteroidetes bacterium 4572_128]